MKKKYLLIVLSLSLLTLVLYGCNTETENDDSSNIDWQSQLDEKDASIDSLEEKKSGLEEDIERLESKIEELKSNKDEEVESPYLLSRSIDVVNLIKDKSLDELESYIHPDKGVRITPYPYVDLENDQVFKAKELSAALEDSKLYTWGKYDGSGETLELNFSDYYDEFIYDEDFANPEMIGNNTILSGGNTIENVEEAYPNGEFTEFYFSGIDPQYSGIDWRSLKLVFEKQNNIWFLVAIIHGEWTI